MYRIVSKTRALQGVIVILTLFIMITIYPIRMWEETIPSVSNQIVAGESVNLRDNYLLQRFIAQYDHLETINVYIADFQNGWDRDKPITDFNFKLMDSDMEVMFDQQVETRFSDIPGFCTVYVNEDLVVGKDYYYFLQGNKNDIRFGLEETAGAGTPYVSRLVENYDEVQGYNVIAEYNYSVPLRKQKVFLYDFILLVAAAALVAAAEWYGRRRWRNKFVTLEKTFRYTANPLIVAGTVGSMAAVWPFKLFGSRLADILFYELGILLCAALLLYGVNHKRDRSRYVPLFDKLRKSWPDFLQSVFIAGAIWACCNYMNGLYDIHHTIAERQMMLFFALAVIVTYTRKELINIINVVYAVIALAAGLIYYYANYSFVTDGEMGLSALKLLIWVAALAGLVVINTIRLLVKRQVRGISAWYGIILALFFALIIIFRNTRWWPVALVVSFTLFYLRFSAWGRKEKFLLNLCNGILLNFGLSMVFALMHRPFVSWIYPRYPFIFHTVTVTAVYLTMVVCAALVKLADRFAVSRRLSVYWKEAVLFGLAMAYMLFTASRTGLLAVFVMALVTVVFTARGKGKEKLRSLAGLAGAMVLSTLICFPVAFSAQRMIPAVCDDTYIYEIEEYPDAITRGNEWNSMYYITVERFKEVFANKIFGIPESGSNAYEKTEEYQEYLTRRFDKDGNVIFDGSVDDLENISSGEDRTDGGGEIKEIGVNTGSGESSPAPEEKPEEAEAQEEKSSLSEATEEYANGRLDIFRSYLEQLNATGHDTMGALLKDGTEATHAHNIYLQIAYDHGIPVGVIFLLLGAASFVQAVIYYQKKREKAPCAFLPAAVIVAFALAGLVEWIFHLCNPAGFILLLVLAPLLFDMEKTEN